ncbi:MAG: PilN domain-containing protein [bacterium]
MQDIDLLPVHYKQRQQIKKRKGFYWLICLIFFCSAGWHLHSVLTKIDFYQAELAAVQQQLRQVEAELNKCDVLEYPTLQHLELLEQLVNNPLPWQALLQDMEKMAPLDLVVDKMQLEPTGKVMLKGRGVNLFQIAQFLESLAAITYLQQVELISLQVEEQAGISYMIAAEATVEG